MKIFYLAFINWLTFLENFIAAAGLIFATFATIWQIANRYWIHYEGAMWLGDFTLYAFTFSLLIIIAMTTREDAHTSVDILVSHLFNGEVSSRVCKILTNILSIGAIILPLPLFYKFFLRSMRYPEWGTLCPWFNTSWLAEAMFIMFILCLFHVVHNTIMIIIQLFNIHKNKKNIDREKGAAA